MESTYKSENKTRKISTSGKMFGVGAAMFVVTVVMTAVGGTYGAMLSAGIAGTAFALGINAFKREQKARKAQ